MERILYLNDLFNLQSSVLNSIALEGLAEQQKLFSTLLRATHILGRDTVIRQLFGSEELFNQFEESGFAVFAHEASRPSLADTLQFAEELKRVQLAHVSKEKERLIFTEDELSAYFEESMNLHCKTLGIPRPPTPPAGPPSSPGPSTSSAAPSVVNADVSMATDN